MIDHKDELLVQFWTYLDRPAHPKRRASATIIKETQQQQEGEQKVEEDKGKKDEEEVEQVEQEVEEEEVGLDSLQASYFCKTIGVLLSKYPIEVKKKRENRFG